MAIEKDFYNLKKSIIEDVENNPVLIPACGVVLRPFTKNTVQYASALADHYHEAYNRGDFFGSRYLVPSKSIFNPGWFRDQIDALKTQWFIFTKDDELVGSTALFDEAGDVNIDETQIGMNGRGMKIMDAYFKRMVPLLEKQGADITTEFVLTPGSKSLRRSLQTDLGMVAVGIHPYILRSPLGFVGSEISAIKAANLEPREVIISQEYQAIFDIVANQLDLPKPQVVPGLKYMPGQINQDEVYFGKSVSDKDLDAQQEALIDGFKPVAYNPKKGLFEVIRFPLAKPDLDFIIAEGIKENSDLVRYLKAL